MLSPRLRTVSAPVGVVLAVVRSGISLSVISVPRDGGDKWSSSSCSPSTAPPRTVGADPVLSRFELRVPPGFSWRCLGVERALADERVGTLVALLLEPLGAHRSKKAVGGQGDMCSARSSRRSALRCQTACYAARCTDASPGADRSGTTGAGCPSWRSRWTKGVTAAGRVRLPGLSCP